MDHLTALRLAVAVVALLVVGQLVVLGVRFGIRLLRAHRDTAPSLVVPPVALGAFGLATLIAAFAWGTWTTVGHIAPSPGAMLARFWVYLVALLCLFVAVIWTGSVQRKLEELERGARVRERHEDRSRR